MLGGPKRIKGGFIAICRAAFVVVAIALLLSVAEAQANNQGGILLGGDSIFPLQFPALPFDFKTGPDGKLYVAANGAVLVIGENGKPVVVAGGAGSGDRIDSDDARNTQMEPKSIAFGPNSRLYIGDDENGRVLAVDLKTNRVELIAGKAENTGPDASQWSDNAKNMSFSRIRDIAFGPDKRLYVADCDHWGVIAIDVQTSKAELVFDRRKDESDQEADIYGGNPTAITFGPGGKLFISDSSKHHVIAVNIETKAIDIVVGGHGQGPGDHLDETKASYTQLNSPGGIRFGPDQRLYIADCYNHSILAVDLKTNQVEVVAGGHGDGFRVDPFNAKNSQLSKPLALGFGPEGKLYVAEYADRVITVDLSNNRFEIVSGGSPEDKIVLDELDGLYSLVPGSDGKIYIAESENNRVQAFNLQTGATQPVVGSKVLSLGQTDFTNARKTQLQPQALAFGLDKRLYIADSDNHRVLRVDLKTGGVEIVAGGLLPSAQIDQTDNPQKSQLNFPIGLAFDPDGRLYIADGNNHRVLSVNLETWKVEIVAGGQGEGAQIDPASDARNSQLNFPVGLAFGPDKRLYISDRGNDRVLAVNTSTYRMEIILGDQGEDNRIKAGNAITPKQPHALVFGFDGRLYVADSGNHRILCVNTQTKTGEPLAITVPGESTDTMLIEQPYGLAFLGKVLFVTTKNLVFFIRPIDEFQASLNQWIKNGVDAYHQLRNGDENAYAKLREALANITYHMRPSRTALGAVNKQAAKNSKLPKFDENCDLGETLQLPAEIKALIYSFVNNDEDLIGKQLIARQALKTLYQQAPGLEQL